MHNPKKRKRVSKRIASPEDISLILNISLDTVQRHIIAGALDLRSLPSIIGYSVGIIEAQREKDEAEGITRIPCMFGVN